MAHTRAGDLSAGHAMLGMLIQHPDSIAGLKLRLEQEHPSGGWGGNVVHNTVPGLARRGLARVASEGHEPGLSVYEVTEEGVRHFRKWLDEPSRGLPALRDGLRAKLRYIEDEAQLDALVRDIDHKRRLFAQEGERALERNRRAQIGASTQRASELQARVNEAVLKFEAASWFSDARELARLAERLRDPYGANDELSDGADD